jgi:hypothetical protein
MALIRSSRPLLLGLPFALSFVLAGCADDETLAPVQTGGGAAGASAGAAGKGGGGAGKSGAAGTGGTAGAAGKAGAAGTGGTGGTGGSAGKAGSAGAGGVGGSAGKAGAAGTGGTGGSAGKAGSAGTGGTGGSAGKAGSAGTGGTGGTAGSGGSAGVGGSAGTGGSAGMAGSAGSGGSTATCSDSTKNGNETDTDCGGGTCPACDTGKACVVDSDCTSQYCFASTCQVRTLTTVNSSLLDHVTVDDANVYFCDRANTAVLRTALDGSGLVTFVNGTSSVAGIANDATTVFWLDGQGAELWGAPKADATMAALVSATPGSQAYHALAQHAGILYSSRNGSGGGNVAEYVIGAGPFTDVTPLPITESVVVGLAVDDTSIYYASVTAMSVYSVPLATPASPETLLASGITANAIDVRGTSLFLADGLSPLVYEVPTAGGTPVPVASCPAGTTVLGVASNATSLFFTCSTGTSAPSYLAIVPK